MSNPGSLPKGAAICQPARLCRAPPGTAGPFASEICPRPWAPKCRAFGRRALTGRFRLGAPHQAGEVKPTVHDGSRSIKPRPIQSSPPVARNAPVEILPVSLLSPVVQQTHE